MTLALHKKMIGSTRDKNGDGLLRCRNWLKNGLHLGAKKNGDGWLAVAIFPVSG